MNSQAQIIGRQKREPEPYQCISNLYSKRRDIQL